MNILNLIIKFIFVILSLFKGKTVLNASEAFETIKNNLPEVLPIPIQNTENDSTHPQTNITIPDRSESFLSGSDFVKTIMNIPANQKRDNLIFEQCKIGNIPNFMRNFVEINLTIGNNSIKYWVSPDVLCIGNNNDFVRVPMGPLTYQKVANLYNCVLPTRAISNIINRFAIIRIEPIPKGPPYDTSAETTETFIWHNRKIEEQRANRSGLISGIKKDVVIARHLLDDPSRVAIYGWFKSDGNPIQGLNATSHSIIYQDYAHSMRLVSRNMIVNNKLMDFYDILEDPNLCNLISDEGNFNARNIYKS